MKALKDFLSPFFVGPPRNNRMNNCMPSFPTGTRSKNALGHPLGIGSSTEEIHTARHHVQKKVFDRVLFLAPILAEGMLNRDLPPHSKSAVLSLPTGRQVCHFLCTSKESESGCWCQREFATIQLTQTI